MTKVSFDVNQAELIKYTKKLDKMRKFDLPLSVRAALNETAFQMKTDDLPEIFERNFTVRRRFFIKSHSAFNKAANTFDINKMQSEAGVYGGRGNDEAGERLKLQEFGGVIQDRAVPFYDGGKSNVRTGSSESSKIASRFFYRKFAKSKVGNVGKIGKYNVYVTKKAVIGKAKGQKSRILYILNKSARIPKNEFVKPAGLQASKGLARNYVSAAEKRIAKYQK